MMRGFRDRRHAGERLAALLASYAGRHDLLVLGLPRGGVPVAAEVARALEAPLDVLVVRKLGVPGREELAMGAIASGGLRVLNVDVIDDLGIPPDVIDRVEAAERVELERRRRQYRDDRRAPDVGGRTVVLVDDGMATGSTMRAAALAVRAADPAHLVIAVPVGAVSVCGALAEVADDVVCAASPEPFAAVGLWYDDFAPTTDDEVRRALDGGDRP